jgi:hypothetical protein
MSNEPSGDWLTYYDEARLTPRYFVTIGLLVLQEMCEFYDFFLVGYLVAVIAPSWRGQSAVMLLSAGVGAIAKGGFPASDLIWDPFYKTSIDARVPVLIHSGLTGIGQGLPGGCGIILRPWASTAHRHRRSAVSQAQDPGGTACVPLAR